MKTRSYQMRALRFLAAWCALALCAAATDSFAQYQLKFMSAGSLHSWYSAIGCEIEVGGPVGTQQDGLQWPAIHPYQDAQAAKGMWIGAVNFTDETGTNYPYKVVHVGPRVNGANEFFPIEFKMVSRFAPPEVTVDGEASFDKPVDNDEVDPTMKADRMIINVVNSGLGITMTRKIMQFSQEFHDNYIVYEYTYTNTGNTDADADIELPNTTLEGVYFYFQYRYSVCANTRYVIGNATGWGINSMLDTRGDGVKVDPPNENFRAQYAWHGRYPAFTAYDNIGGPIWAPGSGEGTTEADTTGRLGASQFVGVVTLHADRSATDKADDPSQPSTTSYEGSDEPLQSNNSAFNLPKMALEYEWMSKGHVSPRHADKVEPSGNFIEPTGDPALGTPGGFSNANGYGPYTLRPGESVRIVMAEGMSGLSRIMQERIGQQYKRRQITAREKNIWVMTGRDSLFQTFRRAIANFNSGYNIPRSPLPPKSLTVESGGDRINLLWDVYENDPNLSGFEIYRAVGRRDSTYYLIHTAGPQDRSYSDTTPIRGRDYYYYLVAVGKPEQNDGSGLTPRGALRSNRYYAQTYNEANLKRQAGTSLSQIRVVPNPYHLSSTLGELRFDQPNQIKFFDIPGQCTIKIFTESGELIQTLEHTDGSGDEEWNLITSSNQVIVSGVYIAVVTNNDTGESEIVKFVVIR